MLKDKSLSDYKNLFSPNYYGRNDKIIFSVTKKVKIKKLYCVICGKYRKFEKPKMLYIFEKALVLPIICNKWKNEDEKIFKEEESTEILNLLL